MKILRILLKNFANIKTALKCNEIEIDFSNHKNRIILFTGPNGSGKTSILSCIHPFATNGSLDIRNDISLIIEGKEGYKEIEIEDNGNIYLIKHFYIPSNKTHSTKSYIMKNGVELNENGNVRSFKEYIKTELDLEQDYLKLVRLGNNVTNFIDMKTTERKSFMGKILNEVDIYLQLHKKVNKDMIEMKSIISHLIDKLSKLNITDKNEFEKYQKKLLKEINKLSEMIQDYKNKLSVIQFEINQYDSPLVVKEALFLAKKKQDKIIKVLSKKDTESMSLGKCNALYLNTLTKIASLQVEIANLSEKRFESLNQMDNLLKDLEDIQNEINRIKNSSELKNIESMISNLRVQIESRSKENNLASYKPVCNKKEFESIIIALDRCNDIILTTYEFGKEPIKKAVKMFSLGDSIDVYIEKRQNKIQKDKLQASCEYVYNEILKKIGKPKANCKFSENCDLGKFYNELYDLATEIPDAIIEDEIFVTYTKMAYQNLSTISSLIKEHASIITKLSSELQMQLSFPYIIKRILDFKSIYDKSIFYSELTQIIEYENQQEDLQKLTELKERRNIIKKTLGNSEYFEKKLIEIQNTIETTQTLIDSISDKLVNLQNELDNMTSYSHELQDIEESIKEKDSNLETIKNLQIIYDKLIQLFSDEKDIEFKINELEFSYNKKNEEYNNNDYRLKSYIQLSSELSKYNESYDEINLIKNALSSKEGIPLLYIKLYLKNIQEITNELLDIIYDGDLYIEDFNISADEFKIPYVTKNTVIKDACYASQGERSFISLALSFALIYQSISNYNILLLDEIDATLDTKNREKFLQILEKQIDMIDGEQVFVISHNNMFNMYPVDIISLYPDDLNGKTQKKSNSLSTYIPIILK